MQLFYTTTIQDGAIVLTEEEARHCSQVLRKQAGDVITVVDGSGTFYTGELLEIRKKQVLAKIIKSWPDPNILPYHLHIAIAPTKNISRLEWFLEKATEIGIHTITPILCAHSERKVVRLDRLEKILVAAMKQSLKAQLPQLKPLIKLKDFLTQDWSDDQQKYIAYCGAGDKVLLKHNYQPRQNVCILIGPEGDFSPEEFTLAQENGFSGLSLGQQRLRTETAGIVACHSIYFLNES